MSSASIFLICVMVFGLRVFLQCFLHQGVVTDNVSHSGVKNFFFDLGVYSERGADLQSKHTPVIGQRLVLTQYGCSQ